MEWPHETALDSAAGRVVSVAAKTPCDVYVGRTFAGRTDEGWGNPYPAGKTPRERRDAVVRYFHWLQGTDVRARELRARIRQGELTDKTLGCWCAADEWWTSPCHGHVLAGLAAGQAAAVKAWVAELEALDLAGGGRRRVRTFGAGDLGLAIDGNNLAHRAHHARPDASLETFVSLTVKACDIARPDLLVVCFDGDGNARRARHGAYKAGRKEKDLALVSLLDRLPERLAEAGVVVYRPDEWEADDALASYARAWTERGGASVLHSADRDLLATVGPANVILRPGEVDPVGVQTVVDKYGVRPDQYLEFAALRGDTSDNLPGVPGVGPKKAAAVVNAATLDEHVADGYARLDAGLAAKLAAHQDDMLFTREMMRLRTDLEVDPDAGWRSDLDADVLARVLGPKARRLARA